MSDPFEEWDFRTRQRIMNLPDIEDGDNYTEEFTTSDILIIFIIAIGFFSFWGGIIWLLK